jgi:hypothetical protein
MSHVHFSYVLLHEIDVITKVFFYHKEEGEMLHICNLKLLSSIYKIHDSSDKKI